MKSKGDVMAKGVTNLLLIVSPFIIFVSFHLSVPPLKATIEYSWIGVVIYYSICLAIFLVLRRKLSVVKDHEYHRSKAMKKIKEVYKAEEEGVWDKEVSLNETLSTPTSYTGQVGSLTSEPKEIELDTEEKVEVSMLTESTTVRQATGDLYADSQNSASQQMGTIGAVRQPSPMDRFLDLVGSWFGRDSKQERQQKKNATLQAQASSKPVIAQRPVAPMKSLQESDDEAMRITSFSDTGGIDDSLSSSGELLESPVAISGQQHLTQSESIESMAMMSTMPQSQQQTVELGGLKCRGCGTSNQSGERFCQSCGLDL
ncbi:MAG: zinc ribbon domain-containing protein [Candidatus Poseidoniales archaeon]